MRDDVIQRLDGRRSAWESNECGDGEKQNHASADHQHGEEADRCVR
jgi:hypothetical protein